MSSTSISSTSNKNIPSVGMEIKELINNAKDINKDWLGDDEDIGSVANTDKLIELYFAKRERLYEHNYESMHQFFEAYLPLTKIDRNESTEANLWVFTDSN